MKKILMLILGAFLAVGAGVAFVNAETTESTSKPTKSEETVEMAQEEVKEDIPWIEKAQAKVPFEIKLPDPNLIPEDIKDDIYHEVEKKHLKSLNMELDYVEYSYGNPRKSISVYQTQETAKPPYIDELKEETIDGVTIYIEEMGDSTKIYFWDNQVYYLVKGEAVSQDLLRQIVRSIIVG